MHLVHIDGRDDKGWGGSASCKRASRARWRMPLRTLEHDHSTFIAQRKLDFSSVPIFLCQYFDSPLPASLVPTTTSIHEWNAKVIRHSVGMVKMLKTVISKRLGTIDAHGVACYSWSKVKGTYVEFESYLPLDRKWQIVPLICRPRSSHAWYSEIISAL